MAGTSKQYGQASFSYQNGLGISNNATTPNTQVDIALGSTLDSTETFQMILPASVTINAANRGYNGLDAGALAASTVYAIHLISDPVAALPTGAMLSTSTTAPILPFGYSAFKLIGYITTGGASTFLLGRWSAGNSTRRTFMYDAPQATAITAGHAIAFTAVTLNTLVPATANNRMVWITSSHTPATAGNTLALQPAAGTGTAATITGQVATVAVTTVSYLFASLVTTNLQINYKVTNASDTAVISVLGYEF